MHGTEGARVVGDMPVPALVDECPLSDLEPAEPATGIYPAPPRTLRSDDPAETLLALLASSNVASRRWAFEQYDWLVGSRTVRPPQEAHAAVPPLPQRDRDTAPRRIGTSVDGHSQPVGRGPHLPAG